MSGIDDDLVLARRLADAAAAVTLTYWKKAPREWRKPDGSVVTEADHAAETRLRELLAEARPADAILGEEFGLSVPPGGPAARRWILDGIDGTAQFAERSDAWGTLIALEVDGRVTLGLCIEPARQRLTWALRGAGAFRSVAGGPVERLAVSGTDGLVSARGWVPPPRYIPDADAQQGVDRVRAVMRCSDALTYHPAFDVASGQTDAAVFYTGGPWDFAAPALIVEEAGGRFTDLAGQRNIHAGQGLYSNGLLHDALLAVADARRQI
ncbi:MAG: inositol monophosphatase [Vicinamibacterales bacterium]